jgi:hypothetical protein
MKTEIPYRAMVKENDTLAEYGPLALGEDYFLKVRVKEFGLVTKEGDKYRRGPCISIQLYHGPRFLKAISIPNGKEQELESLIIQACNFILEEV